MAEARFLKLCTQVGYIKSYQKNKKITPKSGVVMHGHVTYLKNS